MSKYGEEVLKPRTGVDEMYDFLLNTKKRHVFLLVVLMYVIGITINFQFKTVVGGIYIIATLVATIIFGLKINFGLYPFTIMLSVIADMGRKMPIQSFYIKQLVFALTLLFGIYTGLEIKKYVSRLVNRKKEVARLSQDIVLAFINTIEAKDGYLCGHSLNVSFYAKHVCLQMSLPLKDCKDIALAGIFHDIGKIGVCESVLNKPGRLNDSEWEQLKKHPEIGWEIVDKIGALKDAAEIIRYHHLHYNGKGYPTGLKGEEIPLGARIIAVSDSFDAMTSDRPYRKALSFGEACRELERCSGTQFDPWVVRAFLNCPFISQTRISTNDEIIDEAFELLHKMYA